MDRTPTDSSRHLQMAMADLVEAYLFDQPDVLTLAQGPDAPWPRQALDACDLTLNGRQGSLLHRASADGRLVWINALLAQGANPWQTCPEGLPPLAWAAQAGQSAAFLRLLAEPGRGEPPLPGAATTLFHLVMGQPDPVVVEAFLAWWSQQGDVFHLSGYDRPDAQGAHPTHLAAVRPERAAETLQRLIELGFSAQVTDRYDRTPQARLLQMHPPAVVTPLPTRNPRPTPRWTMPRAASRRRPS